jgi:NADH-quinone oxidoreductase subunit A
MRYYVITMLFVIFDIEAVFLYPWAVVFKQIGLYALWRWCCSSPSCW